MSSEKNLKKNLRKTWEQLEILEKQCEQLKKNLRNICENTWEQFDKNLRKHKEKLKRK